MPRKINPDRTHGEKLISLFAKLLFSKSKHSLTELSQHLDCSKQTVQRLVEQIQSSYSIIIDEEIKGNKKYYSIKGKYPKTPLLNLTDTEYHAIEMCKAFTEHLLGKDLFEDATRALYKSHSLLQQRSMVSSDHFATFRPGSIDYTPHQEAIRKIIEGMDQLKICKITYQAIFRDTSKTFYIKPLKLFSHRETLYLHAQKAKKPGKKYKEPDYDPLLAVHRIKKVELTEQKYEIPNNFDFEKAFNQNFGVMKDNVFKVDIEFTGFAAGFVAERIWSSDQKIIKKRDGGIKLIFSASSEPETVAWVLSFGDEARVIKPKWLSNEIKKKIEKLYKAQQNI